MNTIDTSFSYQYPTSYNYSQNSSLSASPRNSRVEIYFDQSKHLKSNSPINARLRYYNYPKSRDIFTNHSEQTSPISSPRASTIQQLAGQQKPPQLLRSVSMPTMNDPDRSPHSRKSSILSNCTHVTDGVRDRSNSCVSCQNSIITMNSDEQENQGNDFCRRHHHRRESVAIKFTNPQIIDQPEGEQQERNSTDVFESLKNYELK